jgi:ankyrin repeat protein
MERIIIHTDDIDQLLPVLEQANDLEKDIALGYAVRLGKEDFVRLLLDFGAYSNALIQPQKPRPSSKLDETSQTPVFPNARRVLHQAFEDRNISIMRLLLDKQAVIDKPYERRGETTNIVREALKRGDRDMIRFIAEYGRLLQTVPAYFMDIVRASQAPVTNPRPLHTYVTANDAAALESHVEGATEIEKDEALAYAVHHRRVQMVRILLDHKAYPDAAQWRSLYNYPDEMGRTLRQVDAMDGEKKEEPVHRVLHEAYDNKDFHIVGLLLRAWCNRSLAHWYARGEVQYGIINLVQHAVLRSNTQMLNCFKLCGWNMNERALSPNAFTPLLTACDAGNNLMIDYLTNLDGVNVDIQCGDRGDRVKLTNIHTCIKKGNRQGLNMLLYNNVDVNVYDSSKYSALAYAIQMYIEKIQEAYDLDDYFRLDDINQIVHEDPHDPNDLQNDQEGIKRRRGIIKDILNYNVDFAFPMTIARPDPPELPIPTTIQQLVAKYKNQQHVDFLKDLDDTPIPSGINPPSNHVDFQDGFGRTALNRAALNGQLDAVKKLISMNARQDIRDIWGYTVRDALRYFIRDQVAKLKESLPERDRFFIFTSGACRHFRFSIGDSMLSERISGSFNQIHNYLHNYLATSRVLLTNRLRRPTPRFLYRDGLSEN